MDNGSEKPNILLILADDMGYSDIGCYGGEIDTPNINSLAENGLKFTQFYTNPRCSPSRASLLTGLYAHQTGIGVLVFNTLPDGYPGDLNKSCVTLAEVLRENGYATSMSGKWHVANNYKQPGNWPMDRGFERFFGTTRGSGSYFDPCTLTRGMENIEKEIKDDSNFYYTDYIADDAANFIRDHASKKLNKPFFQYVAFTAPHWPLHAKEEDRKKYEGCFDEGWDILREKRMKRMVELGILEDNWTLTKRDPDVPAWEDEKNRDWRSHCMEVYAAQVDSMDKGMGRIIEALKETDNFDNTIIIFLSDNGGCAEEQKPGRFELSISLDLCKTATRDGRAMRFGNVPEILPGTEDTYASYGKPWANLSNTPFREYKHWVHEGGISTPFIIQWPKGISKKGEIRRTPCQSTDVMATVLEVSGAQYPKEFKGKAILPCEGESMYELFECDADRSDRYLYWEHEGNAAVRQGKWKLVKKHRGDWELYDIENDRTETCNLASNNREIVEKLVEKYKIWANRCGVKPVK